MFPDYLYSIDGVGNKFPIPGYLACYIIFSILLKNFLFLNPLLIGSAKILYFLKLQTLFEIIFKIFRELFAAQVTS